PAGASFFSPAWVEPKCSAAGRSLRPDARCLDHLAPLLHLGRHIRAELRRSEDNRRGGDAGKPRFHGWIGQPGIDLAVEPLDDLGWRAARYADTAPRIR